VHRNVELVVEAARAHGLELVPSAFPEGTRTAEDAARAIGVEVGQIVKALVFDVEVNTDKWVPVLALVSGSNRLDEAKLAVAAGALQARRADADRVREVTGFPIGGVPPFGHPQAVRTFVDADLLRYGEVWAAAGTPRDNFSVTPVELVRVAGAVVADLRA
jgi:prolyl-tRNA editing enzyme YbaK/EbsC (Cys-tRNA(Pro) deacylase)